MHPRRISILRSKSTSFWKSQAVQEYEYQSLPGPSSFRLIDVYGVLGDGSLKCDLHTVSLEHHPPYEALSYTWADPFPSDDVERDTAYGKRYLTPTPDQKDIGTSGLSIQFTAARARSKQVAQNEPRFVTIDGTRIPITQNLYDALHMLLLPRGVDGQDGRFNKTALHWSAEEGRLDSVRNLLAQGADLHIRDFFGETPLHYAAERGHLEVVMALLDAGADASLTDNSHRTPLGCATQNNHSNVISFLESRNSDSEFPATSSRVPERLMVWIDALCIDQSNPTERTMQVSMMHRVFNQALRVVVWLGPEDPTTQQAVKDIHFLCRGADWSSQRQQKSLQKLEKLGHRRAFGLRRLFQRSWFERVWIIQELVMAQHVLLYCGAHEILWEDMWRFHTFVPLIPMGFFITNGWTRLGSLPQYAPSIRLLRALRLDHEHRDSRYQTLSNLLRLTMTMLSSKPEDKVYGVLGISQASEVVKELFPAPDYGLHIEEVYRRAALVMLRENEDIDFLLGAPRSPTVTRENLPSWVPDLSVRTSIAAEPLPREKFAAAPGFSACPSPTPDGTSLCVQACWIGTVDYVNPVLDKYTEYYLPAILLEWIRFGLLLPYPEPFSKSPKRRSTVLLETISAGAITTDTEYFGVLWLNCMASIIDEDEQYNLPRWLSLPPHTGQLRRLALMSPPQKDFLKAPIYKIIRSLYISRQGQNYRERLAKGLEERVGTDMDVLHQLSAVWNALQQSASKLEHDKWIEFQSKVHLCTGRRLIILDNGAAGLAPTTTDIGSEVFLIRGFRAPVILDKLSGIKYKFKGEAFVQGMMQGEGYNKDEPVDQQFTDIMLV